MRQFSASICFVFFFICNARELLKRVISLPKFSLYFYLFADSDTVFVALSLSPNSLSTLFYLQQKLASKTRNFSAKILYIFLTTFISYFYRLEDFNIFSNALVLSLNPLFIILLFATHESF